MQIGRSLDATGYSTFDTVSLYAATGAPDIRFDLVNGESSSRRRGGEVATEIVCYKLLPDRNSIELVQKPIENSKISSIYCSDSIA
jgi:hypothetical protein